MMVVIVIMGSVVVRVWITVIIRIDIVTMTRIIVISVIIILCDLLIAGRSGASGVVGLQSFDRIGDRCEQVGIGGHSACS